MALSPPIKLADITAALGLPAPGGGDRVVTGIASLADAGPTELAMVTSDAYVKQFAKTAAMAVVANRKVKLPATTAALVFRVDDTDAAIAKVLMLFAPPPERPPAGMHSSAQIDPTATIHASCAIGANVVIGQRSTLGARVLVHPGVVIGDDVTIGDDCQLLPNVVLRQRVTIGNRVSIHAGTVIGTDGFGYRWDGKQHAKVPQIGTVVIEDDVEIGSCCCVDRAKFGATRIGRGTKIDNLVQVAHNVQIGPHSIIIAQTGIAGSARLGANVILGGQTAVRDHITIGEAANAAARSAIASNVPPKQVVSGMPALPHRQSLREQAALRRLPELLVQVRKLQEEIKRLKK
ncbi:MAG TPA: UDP-3-O-(3-hydroxymyristoyl)glucosamine N-acyltransferase [Tepidisphaeraceae bacterium]|nr:UDP-3-O-(3-hydroxymyristoyl)glucosamine N-acyltransferase [Tepidisphaeraceae bacterium]